MTASMSALSKLRTICRPGRGGVMERPGGAWVARPRPGDVGAGAGAEPRGAGAVEGSAGPLGAGAACPAAASGRGGVPGRPTGASAGPDPAGGCDAGGGAFAAGCDLGPVVPEPAQPPRTASPTTATQRAATFCITPPRAVILGLPSLSAAARVPARAPAAAVQETGSRTWEAPGPEVSPGSAGPHPPPRTIVRRTVGVVSGVLRDR